MEEKLVSFSPTGLWARKTGKVGEENLVAEESGSESFVPPAKAPSGRKDRFIDFEGISVSEEETAKIAALLQKQNPSLFAAGAAFINR